MTWRPAVVPAFQLFRGLSCHAAGVALVKAVNASGRIDQFLFAGEKRMALGADFYMQLLAHRRPGLETIAAGTRDCDLVIIRMYLWFHNLTSFAVYKRCDVALNAIFNDTFNLGVGQVSYYRSRLKSVRCDFGSKTFSLE